MRIILFLGLLFWSLFAASQQIRVLDAENSMPIKGAVIYTNDKQKNTSTDSKGYADLSVFSETDSVIIRQISYEAATAAVKDLIQTATVKLLPGNITTGEVVISANKWEQERRDISQYAILINKKQIELLNPQTTADLLQQSGSVFVQKSQGGGGSPMLRGFATNRVLLVVDGIRFNTSIFRAGNVQNVLRIDANTVENAEVIFGPGSLIYGSDAIGGVMDFHTLSPRVSHTGKVQVSGNVFGRFSSANIEKTGHADLNIGFKKVALLSSFTFSDYEDMRMGANGAFDSYLRNIYQKTFTRFDSLGKKQVIDTFFKNQNHLVQKGSAFYQWNFMQKIRFVPKQYHRITGAFHLSKTGNVPRYDRLSEVRATGEPTFAEWYYGPEEWMMAQIEYLFARPNAAFNEMKMNVAYQQNKESRHDRRYRNRWLRRQFEKVDAVNVNIDWNKNFSNKYHLFYGAEAVLNINDSRAHRLDVFNDTTQPFASRYPNATWMSYAAYVSSRMEWNNKFVFNVGVRYNHFIIRSRFDTTLFKLPFDKANLNFGAATGNIGFSVLPTESWKLYLNFSSGFRAPNVDDIGKVFESAPGILVVPNKDLQAEYSLNGEAGIEKLFGKIAVVQVTGYYHYLLNALTLAPFRLNDADSLFFNGQNNALRAIQNASYAVVWGIQSAARFNFGSGFGASVTFNYQYGRENLKLSGKDSLVAMRHVAPMFGTARITYGKGRWTIELYSDYAAAVTGKNFAALTLENPALFPTDESGNRYSPAWFTLNLKAACDVTRYLTLHAGIENMTDNRYRTYASGIAAAGINFMLAMRARF
jgi:hemoglobin/transferrin/lactoferrin receptor protein